MVYLWYTRKGAYTKMAVSEKKKASNAKWDRNNMTVLGCKVSKEKAEQFRQYAKEHGNSVHKQLLEYVDRCLEADVPKSPHPQNQ